MSPLINKFNNLEDYLLNMTVIYLVGPRGSGKSSVGEVLAKRLGYSHYDQDRIFYKKFGVISDFIVKYGWKKFCDTLFEVLKGISVENSIISTGGSVFMNDTNTGIDLKKVNFCKNKGVIVAIAPSRYILKGAKICFERSNKRGKAIIGYALPPESFKDYLEQYKIKFSNYKKYSDIVIYDNQSLESAVDKIIKKADCKTRNGAKRSEERRSLE